jgi:hypothetical protein
MQVDIWSAPIPAIDCLLVTSVDDATTGLHLRRWPRS